MTAIDYKALYRRRKAAGVCVQCARSPAASGRVRCGPCLSVMAAIVTRHRLRHPETVRIGKLRHYGLSPDDYAALLLSQEGLCAVCGKPPPKTHHSGEHLAVDHDHATGRVRALLCTKCNTGLGCFNDDEAVMMKAIEYLRRQRLRSVG